MASQLLHILIAPELLKRIDDWRFANRIESRAEAVRQLIEAGLTAVTGPCADHTYASPEGDGTP